MKLSYQLPNVGPIEDLVSRAHAEVRRRQVEAIDRAWRDKIAQNIVRDTGLDWSLAYAITESVFRTLSENAAAMPPADLRSGGE
jgi:hypothetical protein